MYILPREVAYRKLLEEIYYRKANSYRTVAKICFPLINKPLVSKKKLSDFGLRLSYRQLNDWDSKGFIPGCRDGQLSWRKFSVADIVTLFILSDIRRSFDTIQILQILANITIKKVYNFDFYPLQYFIVLATQTEQNVLLIIDDDSEAFLYTEATYYQLNKSISGKGMRIVLPFNTYVERIFGSLIQQKESLLVSLNQILLSPKENEILDAIRSGHFKEIRIIQEKNKTIIKKTQLLEGGDFSVKDVERLLSRKNFQELVVTQSNGKIVRLKKQHSVLI